MNKIYLVESELHSMMAFDNESDRNEKALALWQEQIYFLWARTLNWYEGGILTGIEEDASNNVETWEDERVQTYFEVPTQVYFWDENRYCTGIAYKDEIICCCCGGVMEVEEVIESAPDGFAPIVSFDYWVDIDERIR